MSDEITFNYVGIQWQKDDILDMTDSEGVLQWWIIIGEVESMGFVCRTVKCRKAFAWEVVMHKIGLYGLLKLGKKVVRWLNH